MPFDRKTYMKTYKKKWDENNQEHIKEQGKEYYKNNKEERKAYNKAYRENNKEAIKAHRENNKAYMKTYRKIYNENNKEYIKESKKKWDENNQEHIKERIKEYRKTPEGIKSHRIINWKLRGVICDDFNELYDYYSLSTNCEYCWVELVEGSYGNNKKALDHCHITGKMRGVICHKCNINDVFKSK